MTDEQARFLGMPRNRQLWQMMAALNAIAGGSGGDPEQLTPSGSTATESGNVPAGAREVGFIFSSDFTGSVFGMSFTGDDESFILDLLPNAFRYGQIDYVVTTGSVRIVKLV